MIGHCACGNPGHWFLGCSINLNCLVNPTYQVSALPTAALACRHAILGRIASIQ